MKRHLTLALLAALCLAAALPAAAAPLDEGAVAARAIGAPAPTVGEDGLVLFEGHYYHHADGLMSHRHQRLLRVTSEWALERLADPRLRFDSARQKIDVHAARTYFANGEYIDSPANAFNTVTPGELAQAPDFLDIQELVITHVGLEPGCALWLDTEIVDTAPAGLPEGALLFPQGDFPVLEMEVTAEGLYAELVNPEGGLIALPAGTSEGLRHAWHFENLPAAPGQATYRLGDQLPHLDFSPLESWQSVVEAIEASLEAAVADTMGLGGWLAVVERELERPFLDDRDAIVAILAALGERTTLLEGPDWAWRAPRSVARTLETSMATPLERAALMIAVGRTRGLEASLCLTARWQQTGEQVLPLAALDAPWLQTDAGIGYLAPAEGRLRRHNEEFGSCYYFHGRRQRGQVANRTFEAKLNYYWNLAEATFALRGSFAPVDLWAGMQAPETGLRDWCASWTDSCRVDALSLQGGVGDLRVPVEMAGRAPMPAANEPGSVRLALPMTPVPLTALLPAGMQRSQSVCRALLFPPRPAVQLHLSWILDLPAGFEPVAQASIGADCPGGRFVARREQVGRRLTVHYDLEWSGVRVPPADYPAFCALVNAALDPKTTEVLLVPRARD